MNIKQKLEERLGSTIGQADDKAIYYSLLGLTKELT